MPEVSSFTTVTRTGTAPMTVVLNVTTDKRATDLRIVDEQGNDMQATV